MCVCVCCVYVCIRPGLDSSLIFRADLQSCAAQRKMAQRIEAEFFLAPVLGLGALLALTSTATAAATTAINSKAKNFIRNSKHIRQKSRLTAPPQRVARAKTTKKSNMALLAVLVHVCCLCVCVCVQN